MDIKVIASTHIDYLAKKEDFDKLSGKAAGICYMSDDFDAIYNEDIVKTERRINLTKNNGHHSVYDHESFSLYLDGIPKIIAMVINNEKMYTTSEKSGRYTVLHATKDEQLIFEKWVELFKNKIAKLYKNDYPTVFTDKKIEKLAYENARYLTSVFTPTKMMYTTTYRQLNVLIGLIDSYLKAPKSSDFEMKIATHLSEFVDKLKALPYYDKKLAENNKNRKLSLFSDNTVEEYYGDVYATTYKSSLNSLAQAQRHRTLNYSIKVLENEYYIPPIIADNADLVELWLSDIRALGNSYPQATMVEVKEMGTLDNFILKMRERKCFAAQLEINRITNDILKKYEYALRLKLHPRAEEMGKYTKGSRCTFGDYVCPSPCGFKLGIDETRIV